MIEIKGKYNTASIYTDSIEDEAYKQVHCPMCGRKLEA